MRPVTVAAVRGHRLRDELWRRQVIWERAFFASSGAAIGLGYATVIFDFAARSASLLAWVGTALMLAVAAVISLTDTGGKVGS